MIPTRTAIAKSCKTVTVETRMITKASILGMLDSIRRLDHSNVPITTINITPVSAAKGIISTSGAAKRSIPNRKSAAAIPDKRPLPPPRILIILCPIMAQPPMPPKKPFTTFAKPCPIHSLFPRPRVSVSSSTKVRVIKDSISPTAAANNENGRINLSVATSKVISGRAN